MTMMMIRIILYGCHLQIFAWFVSEKEQSSRAFSSIWSQKNTQSIHFNHKSAVVCVRESTWAVTRITIVSFHWLWNRKGNAISHDSGLAFGTSTTTTTTTRNKQNRDKEEQEAERIIERETHSSLVHLSLYANGSIPYVRAQSENEIENTHEMEKVTGNTFAFG